MSLKASVSGGGNRWLHGVSGTRATRTCNLRVRSAVSLPLDRKSDKLAEGGGIEPLGHNAYPGFQDQLPAIQRHLLFEKSSRNRRLGTPLFEWPQSLDSRYGSEET